MPFAGSPLVLQPLREPFVFFCFRNSGAGVYATRHAVSRVASACLTVRRAGTPFRIRVLWNFSCYVYLLRHTNKLPVAWIPKCNSCLAALYPWIHRLRLRLWLVVTNAKPITYFSPFLLFSSLRSHSMYMEPLTSQRLGKEKGSQSKNHNTTTCHELNATWAGKV